MTFPAQPLRFDVSDVIGERASLAATYYPARAAASADAGWIQLIDATPRLFGGARWGTGSGS